MSLTKVNTKLNFADGKGGYFQGMPETSIEQVQGLPEKIQLFQYPFLQRNKAHQVGDIAYSPQLPSYIRMECVQAGTTAATEPDFTENSAGGVLVLDGSVRWILDDLRDGTPVGTIRPSLFVPDGYVKANGATVNRSDYPRLVAMADAYNLWTSDTAANPGLFGEGDGTTTMELPDWTGRMAQFAATAGGAVAAGLPNVTGRYILRGNANAPSIDIPTGAYTIASNSGLYDNNSATSSTLGGCRAVSFNASSSNSIYGSSTTVQPPAINVYPILRY